MAMNKVKQGSQMYQFLNEDSGGNGYTWNVIKGKCPHDCLYCYMKRFAQKELRFDAGEISTDLGVNNFIFVGSSTDMWAEDIPAMWIEDVLALCRQNHNRYLFQSKNSERFCDYWNYPDNTILGCTIETNRLYPNISKAPNTLSRKLAMEIITLPKIVSIEPIMDFDLDVMVRWIKEINPEFVSIGADSQHHNLPEPSPDKVKALIESLQAITTVKVKSNLKRLEVV